MRSLDVDQVAAVTVDSFSLDNSVTDKTTGDITSKNTDTVSGRIIQDAILSSGRVPNTYTLQNVAEALTGQGVASGYGHPDQRVQRELVHGWHRGLQHAKRVRGCC